MRQFDCPQCSAPIPFETPGGVFAVCPNCRSMVVRRDVTLEAIGTMAELPPDHTPLQIGARGTHGNRSFRLLGRLRVAWEDGTWNEWYAEFGNNSYGWVAETQGFFMISEAAALPDDLAYDLQGILPNQTVQIGNAKYKVTDIKVARAVAGEGELPFVAVPGHTWTGIDLAGPGRLFAGIEQHRDETRLFTGVSAQPDEITWEGLRPVPGWNGEPVPIGRNATEALNCVACGGVVQLRLAGVSTTLACSHCGTLIDVDQPKAVLAQKVEKAVRLQRPPLPLGKRGVLRGTEWEVLGCLLRRDPYATWTEILLYNPWQGFAWLTESGRHWNFVWRLLDTTDSSHPGVVVKGRPYHFFGAEEAAVIQVAGEFYWKIRVGETAKISDFIAPPFIVSSETYTGLKEVTWSQGEYVDSGEVAKAFGVSLPQPVDVYMNQPNPWTARFAGAKRIGLIAAVIALVLQLFFAMSSSRKEIFKQDFTFQRPAAGQAAEPIVTPSFELKGSRHPARIAVQAAVDNAWLGMDASLIEETTGKTYPAEVTVEYYHGYDEGTWTEGSQKASTDLPGVPAGRYHLELLPETDLSVTQLPFSVTLLHGGVFWSNFLLCLLAIAIWPAWAFFRYHRFESQRWSQSDFSPYGSSDE